eukprot:TRINITY_DN6017_c0_g1_i2.p2 TRINITY_DN6017_c0_g1~~TRINITY_DN6017_c0_g1_i2.p2  ORF type:complete len:111 (-),score=3.07 TRINITY_DN6017_c0_g1_i2:176-508(-)
MCPKWMSTQPQLRPIPGHSQPAWPGLSRRRQRRRHRSGGRPICALRRIGPPSSSSVGSPASACQLQELLQVWVQVAFFKCRHKVIDSDGPFGCVVVVVGCVGGKSQTPQN